MSPAPPPAPSPRAAAEELRRLYAEFDAETARVSPLCRASGRCCDFGAFGHVLYCSRLEADLLAAEGGPAVLAPSTGLCPWWRERRCTARGPRPLACRAFFCDEAKEEAMGALHEEHLRRLKDLHDRHGIPWSYAPLLRHLEDIARERGEAP
ncbi:MAG: hypothetical protein L6R43_19235 [Planctomycetes bacterium]|nr:hypothetical protein [Planctomycetota bacterium]